MRIHYFQHVPFEGPGSMEPLLLTQGHSLSCTRLYAGETPPAASDLDMLIIMGGPMGIHDEENYPWLALEKQVIGDCLTEGKIILGICLGAQLLADALGSPVFRGPAPEIGWYEVRRSRSIETTRWSTVFPSTFPAFHWHGDTFDIPENALRIGSSDACDNQGFVHGDNVVALQFHLETTPATAAALVEHCADELDDSALVQSADELLKSTNPYAEINDIMHKLLLLLTGSQTPGGDLTFGVS